VSVPFPMPLPMPSRLVAATLTAACCLYWIGPGAASAQEQPALANPAGPIAPGGSVDRHPDGRVVVHSVRIARPPTLDGVLDDETYSQVPPVDGFIQQEPKEGQPAVNRTDAWILYDERNIYVAARCWTTDPSRIVANEMRRDAYAIFQNDNFGVFFDTFHDRRNGYFFYTNPLGAVSDQAITDERDTNRDWNTVWDLRTARFEHGWTVEMVIPFRSLRYPGPGPQTWGIQLRRVVRGSNEFSYLTAMPAAFTQRAIVRVSQAATLAGLEAPPTPLNLELKPYALGKVETNREAAVPVENDAAAAAGLDVKYTLRNGLVADLTLNTDFAQVEDDEQQVNLTRFSLFFPERREFFLEGAGIFAFGGASVSPRGSGQGPPSNTPILFYSRRIGLHEIDDDESVSVPLLAGGRMTGRTGRYTIGLIDIQQRADETIGAAATNFAVVRVKRDILRQSSVGAIVTHRSRSSSGDGASQTYGADAAFTFFRDLTINTYYAQTHAEGRTEDAASYRADVAYAGDRYGFEAEHLTVEDNFDPDTGFLRREDFRRNFAHARFSPRPGSPSSIRKYQLEAGFDLFTDTAGRVQTQLVQLQAGMDLQNGDEWRIETTNSYEFLEEPFEIATGVFLPIGGYRFTEVEGRYQLGPQRRASGSLMAGGGQFYSGTRAQIGYRGRIEVSPRLGVEPGLELNWVDLPDDSFTAKLLTVRVNYNLSPRQAVSALIQYNSSAEVIGANLRFRWEFRPGSDLFVVYNEGRDTALGVSRMEPSSRTFAVKITRLFRWGS